MIHPRLNVLPPAQRSLWPMLRNTQMLGFVLYGGTAVALRCGHRASVDFDFFSDRPLNREALQQALPFLRNTSIIQEEPQTLSMLVGDSAGDRIKLSFFGAMTYGRVGQPDYTDDGVIQIASLDDLMATKLKVMLQRIESKDYRDVAAMLGAGASLARGLAAAQVLYGPAFQPRASLQALVYFQGGDLQSLSQQDKQTLIAAVTNVNDLPVLQSVAPTLGLPPYSS
ncbi:nucleotidyl transferase AbiEii/AbiGii toxin family protein [Nitrospira moscoviensis]|uniref:Nucleotidyl transferase AbiEii/AbiGii toxin family protein n=1 Tax=Nitrospira moscoviensis TaxID=42253 RepID=A0A0K2GJ99_NITMO|nr:nucleotidyl transferase AbiEii/AbiGii toxin family protein [Nitrospira moscoviensis]ALA60712.1 hypothetical protein NITMOv2_4336 [Nitrospira moscoviensis]